MTRLWPFLLAFPALGAVDGTIVNGTTGKPQPNVTVSLIQPGQSGMQTLGSARSDAQGKFRIDKAAGGLQLVQAIFGGVTYNKMVPPGSASTGIQVEVYDSTKDPGTATISQHIVFLQPASEQLTVNEVFFLKNDTKRTFNDPANGTLRFYVPGHSAQGESVRVSIRGPGGMPPIQRPAIATQTPGVYKVDYAAKPGETEFNLSFTLPSATGFASKTVDKGIETRLVVPRGVTVQGDGISALGDDPSGRATLYAAAGQEYSVMIGGSAAPAPVSGGPASASEEDTGAPQIQETNPRLYHSLPVVLGLAIVILLLGFIVLYRSAPPNRENEPRKGKNRQ